MKIFLVIWLLLALALSAVPAWAAKGDATLGRNDDGDFSVYYNGSFSIDDTLYLINGDSISTWHTGETDVICYDVQYPYVESDEDVFWSCWPFSANGKIYALAIATRCGETTEFLRAVLCEVSLMTERDEHIAKLTQKTELNWEEINSTFGVDTGAAGPQSCVGTGNLCSMLFYDASANAQLRLINVDTGEIKSVEAIPDLCAVVPYKDGTLLIEQYNYDVSQGIRFSVYDPRTDKCQEIAHVDVEESAIFSGLAYNAASDVLYCIKGGEIHTLELQNNEIGPAIADAPMEYASDNGACILSGNYYCYASSGVFIRNIDPAQRTETRIRVYDSLYNEPVRKASIALPNAHGEISVAVDQDYSVGNRLVESMLNQDDSVDIYVMSCSDEAYNAVYNRGYMAELDSSQKLTALVERMYPGVQAALHHNGHLVAIPVYSDASTFSVNEKALERLGLKLSDVPTNWMDMLDFIAQLTDRIKPEHKVNLLFENETFEEVKRALFVQMFLCYQNYADNTEPAVGYDTELMRSLLKKLDAIDFTKIGCKHESNDGENSDAEPEGDSVSVEEDDTLSLFEIMSGCSFGNFYTENALLLMSLDSTTPAQLILNLNVAFVNPYSKHFKEALLFMEQLADSMTKETLYCIDPSQNEPIRNNGYEEIIKEMNDELASLKEEYESADAEDKQSLEEQVREQEQSIAEYEKTSWDITPAQIDWYRANDDNVIIQGVEWMYSNQSDGEANELVEQYLAGQLEANAMLSAIESKLKMMRLEGA